MLFIFFAARVCDVVVLRWIWDLETSDLNFIVALRSLLCIISVTMEIYHVAVYPVVITLLIGKNDEQSIHCDHSWRIPPITSHKPDKSDRHQCKDHCSCCCCQGVDTPMETTYMLAETLFVKAQVPPTKTVCLWLGVSTFLSIWYSINFGGAYSVGYLLVNSGALDFRGQMTPKCNWLAIHLALGVY